jgi:hypothetical protein
LKSFSVFSFKGRTPSCHSKLTYQVSNDTFMHKCIIDKVEGNESIIVGKVV